MYKKNLEAVFKKHKELALENRYVHNAHIESLLKKLPPKFSVETIGNSVNNLDIFSVRFGTGPKKLLFWSQMHGNESTTTKALFDLFNLFSGEDDFVTTVMKQCTILVIPILNPDGALAYTRLNANKIDLNRDAQALSQPESIVLRNTFNAFKPDVCFNLHGQRTIYSVGSMPIPATMAFLSPSMDSERSLNTTRKTAMSIIVAINTELQKVLPNQVGRYDDIFNLNCVGDTFQSLGVPTVLFEAGHYKNDYARDNTRAYVFYALIESLRFLSNQDDKQDAFARYFDIPENKKLFYDLILRNATINGISKDVAIQFQEQLIDGKVHFMPKIEKISDLKSFFGHREIEMQQQPVLTEDKTPIYEGYENDFVLVNNELLALK